jgi:hypothetical protein
MLWRDIAMIAVRLAPSGRGDLKQRDNFLIAARIDMS